MDEQEAKIWRFLMWAAPPMIALGVVLYAIGTITLANVIVAGVGLAGVWVLARFNLD